MITQQLDASETGLSNSPEAGPLARMLFCVLGAGFIVAGFVLGSVSLVPGNASTSAISFASSLLMLLAGTTLVLNARHRQR